MKRVEKNRSNAADIVQRITGCMLMKQSEKKEKKEKTVEKNHCNAVDIVQIITVCRLMKQSEKEKEEKNTREGPF